jgi:hypothetical protein
MTRPSRGPIARHLVRELEPHQVQRPAHQRVLASALVAAEAREDRAALLPRAPVDELFEDRVRAVLR